MIKRFQSKKLLTLLLAASLLVLPTQTGTASANEAVALTSLSANGTVSHFDYFSHVYENLNTSHVFKTATYEDIVNLFESEGTYAVLIEAPGALKRKRISDLLMRQQRNMAYPPFIILIPN